MHKLLFSETCVRSNFRADREDTQITRMDHLFENALRTGYASKSLCFCLSREKWSMDLEHDWMAEMAGIECGEGRRANVHVVVKGTKRHGDCTQ